MGYAENMYEWLKRKGYAPKYDHAGIYCIKIDDAIVYIGKSHNMLKRVSQHVHPLITWLSCTDHVTAHALMTWLFGH